MGRATGRLLALAVTAAAFLALGSAPPAPAAEGARVLMVDNEPDLTRWHYEPAEVTVPAGATVVWFNKGKYEHTVTADDKSFDSGMKPSGTSWQRTFTKPGEYGYYCAPHPWMKGTVRVVGVRTAAVEASGTATTTTTTAPSPTAAAPPPSPTSTTFPERLEAQRSDPPAASEALTAPPAPPPAAAAESDEAVAPVGNSGGSGGHLAGNAAVVVLPTLAALGVGVRLRRRSGAA